MKRAPDTEVMLGLFLCFVCVHAVCNNAHSDQFFVTDAASVTRNSGTPVGDVTSTVCPKTREPPSKHTLHYCIPTHIKIMLPGLSIICTIFHIVPKGFYQITVNIPVLSSFPLMHFFSLLEKALFKTFV